MGRATGTAHKKNKDSEEERGMKVPRISLDYFDMGKEDEEGKKNPDLVVLNDAPNGKYARVAGQKGSGSDGAAQWPVEDVAAEMRTWGHHGGEGGTVFLKCGGGEKYRSPKRCHGKIPWGRRDTWESTQGRVTVQRESGGSW